MRTLAKLVVPTLAGMMMATTAHAAIIEFSGLRQTNGAAFTGPYLEDGYSVTATAGQVFEGHQFGAPEPSLVVGSIFNGGINGTVQVVRSGGGSFTFDGFDLIGNNGLANYTVSGFLGAASVFSVGGSQGGTFATLGGAAGVIDRLVFQLTATGTSLNIDNINVNDPAAVPEPSTWAMMVLGFGLVGFAMRRRQTVRVNWA